MSNLIYLVQWQGKNCLCVCHNDHQLFGIGYHFKIFRSRVATGKKVNFTPWQPLQSKDSWCSIFSGCWHTVSNSSLYDSCFVGVIWRPELKKNTVHNTMTQKSSFILLLTPQTLYRRVWSSQMLGECMVCLPKQGSGKVLNSHYQTGWTCEFFQLVDINFFLIQNLVVQHSIESLWIFFILMTYCLKHLDIVRRK